VSILLIPVDVLGFVERWVSRDTAGPCSGDTAPVGYSRGLLPESRTSRGFARCPDLRDLGRGFRLDIFRWFPSTADVGLELPCAFDPDFDVGKVHIRSR
jgi:hypothetical protein